VNDKTAILITGSSRGLGRALAELYTNQGLTVFGCSRSEVDFKHEGYHHIVMDISTEEGVNALFTELSKYDVRPDVLINNAGTKRDSVALLATLEQAQDMMSSNFFGAFLVMREAAKLMKRARFGRIVNISSMAVPLAGIGNGLYAATKAAVEQFSQSLSREFARDDITVNTIGVSVFEDSTMVQDIDPTILKKARGNLLKPSALSVREISHAINFFADPKARNITGQTVYFGGVR
jgi:3-oxoacyl-[acyl-carrier protein] reductase